MTGVPYTFANATTSIPLAELDANFATQITIGSTTVGLGNSTASLSGLTNVSTTNLIVNGQSLNYSYAAGAWTPIDGSGAGLIFTSNAGIYIKVGNLVWVSGQFTIPSNASGANAYVAGLPYTVANTQAAQAYLTTGGSLSAQPYALSSEINTQTLAVRNFQNNFQVVNRDLVGFTFWFQGIYQST